MSEPRASDLIQQTFGPCKVWVERNGVTTSGQKPEWLSWPMHTAAEMAETEWKPEKRGKRK